jgi:hypothetical protein
MFLGAGPSINLSKHDRTDHILTEISVKMRGRTATARLGMKSVQTSNEIAGGSESSAGSWSTVLV